MVTPFTLEIKIKGVLNPFFGAFYGLWTTKSAGPDPICVVKNAGRRFLYISLNSMHALVTR